MKKLAVLISNKGTGTNLQALIDAIEQKKLAATIAAVVCDKDDAKGLTRAKKHNIQIILCYKKEDLLHSLQKINPDFICLAGWMQIILPEVIDAYPERILNVHPGLIPDSMETVAKNPDGTDALWNKGKMTDKAMQLFLDSGTTYAGSTIHFLSHEFDFGKVLKRCFEKIQPDDTIDSLYTRLKVKENQAYVEALEELCL